jgi:hypothetical protein
MSHVPTDPTTLESTKINLETSKIHWTELQRFFANGSLIFVSNELDLVEVALHIAQDDKAQVMQWMQQQKVGQVSDEQAKIWLAADATLWAVVVKPWVLVQESLPADKQLH